MFDHKGIAVVSTMRELTIGVFEHLEITSPMDVDKRVSDMQRILKEAGLKMYRDVLLGCRQLTKEPMSGKGTCGR